MPSEEEKQACLQRVAEGRGSNMGLLLKADGLVKHQLVARGVGIGVEIAEALELEVFDGHGFLQSE